jgi:hypothetical protein
MEPQLLSQPPVCCQDSLHPCVQPVLQLLLLRTLQLLKPLHTHTYIGPANSRLSAAHKRTPIAPAAVPIAVTAARWLQPGREHQVRKSNPMLLCCAVAVSES